MRSASELARSPADDWKHLSTKWRRTNTLVHGGQTIAATATCLRSETSIATLAEQGIET
ncbi:hypothetical protein O9992_02190 [Vibrio lentus]|nr:hypothetical protein [Vibrio lentus]